MRFSPKRDIPAFRYEFSLQTVVAVIAIRMVDSLNYRFLLAMIQ